MEAGVGQLVRRIGWQAKAPAPPGSEAGNQKRAAELALGGQAEACPTALLREARGLALLAGESACPTEIR